MNRFRRLPAIIMLSAGFIACVVMIYNRVDMMMFIWALVCIFAVFFVIGLIIRAILVKAFTEKKESADSEKKTDEETKSEEGSDTSDDENSDELKQN